MGAGFIIGGYCPGTSFSGAAIGKIDAFVFIGGLFLGVFSLRKDILVGWNVYGKIPGITKSIRFFGLVDGVFAFVLILVALAMFLVAERAEKKFPRDEY